VVQVTLESFEQVMAPVDGSVTQVGVQVEKSDLPHVERAAQRVTLPLQLGGRTLLQALRALTRWATQLTYCP
jgi:hypothetical protein